MHTLQLAVNKGFKYDKIEQLIELSSKIVGHFKHSNVTTQCLKAKQEQLVLTTECLIQSCKTRWNSVFIMLDRLYKNRCPVSNVFADRTVTATTMAQKFEVTENQWTDIETIVKLLKPLQVITAVFCGEKHCSISMVRPLLNIVMEKHLKPQINYDEIAEHFKYIFIQELKDRFKLEWNPSSVVSARHIAFFLDLRYKDLEHEAADAREEIQKLVKSLLDDINEYNSNMQIQISETKNNSGELAFLFSDKGDSNTDDFTAQFQNYLTEPQLRFDFDALEW